MLDAFEPYYGHAQRRLAVELLEVVGGHYREYGTALRFAPDDRLLAFWEESGTLVFWDVNQSKLLLPQSPFADSNWALERPSEDALLVQLMRDQHERFGEVLNSSSYCSTLSPDSSILAVSAKDGKVHLYHAHTLEEVAAIEIPDATVALAFSYDGRYLATGGATGDLWIWETATWLSAAFVAAHPDCRECIATGQFDALFSIAWSHDGTLLATSGAERVGNSIKLWLVDEE